MRTHQIIASLSLLTLCATNIIAAPVSTAFTYQGKLNDGGAPATGLYDLQFTLRDAPVGGSGTGLTEMEDVGVTNGLFTVQLDFGEDVFAEASRWLEIAVRRGDTTNAFTLLNPRQPITAAPLANFALSAEIASTATTAMMAYNVPNGAITGAKLAAGAVGATQLAAGAVGATHLALGAVGENHLAAGAVTSNAIAPGSITSGMITSGAITAAHIAPGTIGGTQLAKPYRSGRFDPSALLLDFHVPNYFVSFNPPFASTPIVTLGVETSSQPLSEVLRTWLSSTSPTGFNVVVQGMPLPAPVTIYPGGYQKDIGGLSLAEVEGRVAVASKLAWHWFTNPPNQGTVVLYEGDLIFTRQTMSNTWTTIAVDTNGITGGYPSLDVVNGRPAMSYQRRFQNLNTGDFTDGELKYVRANDAEGAAWSSPVVVDTSAYVGSHTSLAVVNGNPAISYFDETNRRLKFVRASNVNGTSWNTPVVVDDSGSVFVGLNSKMAVVNGNPAICYYHYVPGSSPQMTLKYVRATDPNGTAWGTPVPIGATDYTEKPPALLVVDGCPAVCHGEYFVNAPGDGLKFVRASDLNGDTWGAPQMLTPSGTSPSLVIYDNRPAVSYVGDEGLTYQHASDAAGTSWLPATPVAVPPSGQSISSPAMRIIGNSPFIVFAESISSLTSVLKGVGPVVPDFRINWIAVEP